MKHLYLVVISILLASCSNQLSNVGNYYDYKVSIVNIVDDQIDIELIVPSSINKDSIIFSFPKIIPGIYGAINSGKFIENLIPFDSELNELSYRKINTNQWVIYDAFKLRKITYSVDDGWEKFDKISINGFYKSAESAFDEKFMILNNNTIYGYFENLVDLPIEIEIKKPANYYGATSLNKETNDNETDIYSAKSYAELIDNPILYSEKDATQLEWNDIKIEIACYSSSGKKISKDIATAIKPLIEGQRKYLKGKFPVEKYTFLIYHNDDAPKKSILGDGLEHSYSTLILYNMLFDEKIIKEGIYRVASHEVFHILIPLNLHSKELHYYDYNDPKPSKHLWLYEGMTEYFTMHMPIVMKLKTLKEFTEVLSSKANEMAKYDNNISLTTLSLQAMQKQDQYYNFYLRGALTNLCFDIKLRELTNGNYGVRNLVEELTSKYGKNIPFDDNELFADISKIMGNTEVDLFIEKYIDGNHKIPLQEYLNKIGLVYNQDNNTVSINNELSLEQKTLRANWLKNL